MEERKIVKETDFAMLIVTKEGRVYIEIKPPYPPCMEKTISCLRLIEFAKQNHGVEGKLLLEAGLPGVLEII